MLLTLSIFPLLQAQFAEWNRNFALRYDQRSNQIKQQLEDSKIWYEKTKSAAQDSGTIPLEQKQAETDNRFAEAGAVAARKEAVIKQQLKDLWHSIRNR